MGPGTLIEEFVEDQPIQFDVGILRAVTRSEYHRLRVVKGIGDSMEPTLRTGDRVLVDTTDRQLSRLDGIYWITLYGAHGIKRLKPAARGRIMVISDNRDVSDPVEVDAEDVTIDGRIIWFSRDL
jgi:phage repressor protein C with HTH and peptisase S24 domain